VKGPYENNKVYAIAAARGGLKHGFVPAVFAQVRYNNTSRVSDDVSQGQFFLCDPEDNEGTAEEWYPDLGGALLSLSEDEGPYDLPAAQVLSLWSDREEAWKAFEARRVAGRKGATSRKQREAEEKMARMVEKSKAYRAAKSATPAGRLEEHPGIEHVFRVPARHERPEAIHLDLALSPKAFRKVMAWLKVDEALVEEFLTDTPEAEKLLENRSAPEPVVPAE
jgi:hypothetical protein